MTTLTNAGPNLTPVSSSVPGREAIRKLEDTTLLAETIKVCKGTTKQIEKTAIYLDECRVRFDNRGKPGRIIDGYKGFLDFLGRGCGIRFREAYRIMERYFEPGKVAKRNKQRRTAAKAKKALIEKPAADPTPSDVTAILTTLSLELGLKLGPFTRFIEKATQLSEQNQTDVQTLICSLQKISKDLGERADRLDAALAKSKQGVAA